MKTIATKLMLFLGLLWLAGCASWREAWEHTPPIRQGTPVTERDLLLRSQENSLFFWPSQLAPPPGFNDWGAMYPAGDAMSVDWLSRGWHDPRGKDRE